MSPYRRNVLVGLTMLAGLTMLGWMIIKFGGGLGGLFAPEQFAVTFRAERAEGINEGSPILFRGVEVGRIGRVELDADRLSVRMTGMINSTADLPGNLAAAIRTQSALGTGAAMVLSQTGPQRQGTLSAGDEINARFVGLEFLPPEFADLATELRGAVEEFRKANLIGHIDEQVLKAGRLIDSVQSLVGDEQIQRDVRQSIANVRTATESAARVGQSLEKLATRTAEVLDTSERHLVEVSVEVTRRLQQISTLLEHVESVAGKIDRGEGTAGLLVNDNRLYESLVDTARQLNTTVNDLNRLVEQWEQEGVTFKLN